MIMNHLKIAWRNLVKNKISPLVFFLISFIIVAGPNNIARAQDTLINVAYKGKLDSIHSNILQQTRLVQVFIPPGYTPGSTDKYDVLYVLDGSDYNMGLISNIQRFIQGDDYMPPTIIVSVMAIDRSMELTPIPDKSWDAPSGGGDKFLGFIANELIPYINKTYPSNGVNTLWGHSLGGMFTMYALLKQPTAFKSYILSDPSLWWGNGYVPKMAVSKLPALAGLHITLFIGARQGPSFYQFKIDTMEMILKKLAPADLTWKLNTFPYETHSSVRLKDTYDGLKFTYSGYTNGIGFDPMDGLILKDKPFELWYGSDDTTRVYYTLDGTVPTELSAKVQREITVTGAANVTYKRFTNRSSYDKTATGSFIEEKMMSPVSKPTKSEPGGFNYAYYEGDWDKWPDIRGLKPLKTGIANKGFEASLPRKNNYALVIDGFLETKEDGYYIFYVQAGKGSKLYIGDKLLIQWDDDRAIRSFLVPLSKGFYPLRMEYLDKKGDFKWLLYHLTPSIINTNDPVAIPLEAQYGVSKK
jgi:predicted alpha/beta superfamily hydrolase